MSVAHVTEIDNRITEIIDLARAEGRPLALSPVTIVALEDNGWLADPFTGQLWPDPAQEQTAPATTIMWLVEANQQAEAIYAAARA
jgi:hypothetical protein